MNSSSIKNKDFEKIISLYDRKIERVIGLFEKNNENVKDIKQDIYLKLFYKNLYTEDCINTWGWLKQVVSNHCKNYLRDNSKIKFFNTDDEKHNILENIEDNNQPCDSNINAEYIQEFIYKKVCSLKPKYRDVIIFYDYEELSYEQIAKKLDCPVGTVKSRIFKARMLLKKELKELLE